ncbi:tyrosine--tRNA ligase [Feifania hominis]|uniref:Tyrosine--tRNA ligase n=1 Tax=Feifania hominis TaxID=2763660 RepID=A0A926DCZ5_9FIRM|nr:tyrosine--tRNA ligase [Feifania hominis]MBC8535556.1 tyrosine--tRNA ligase [Feifania hominis]
MGVFQELKSRGLIAQATHEQEIEQLLEKEHVTFYVGFDPTADSLHIGHYLQLLVMSHMQRAGHRPIALIGGGTGMIGDPTGRADMRQMMTVETIEHNCECFKKQMSRLVDFSEGKALMVNNGDWLLKLNYIDFLREIGVHFSVNKMLTYECFKSRFEKGLSFLEFNYMPMQSYDFLTLYRKYGCRLQLGGNDQWSNIIGGVELIRRIEGGEAYGMTFNLLTTSDGKKMGKTQKGAVWLDADKFSPYDFFQYWRNVDDGEVVRFLKMLTFLPVEEIEREYAHLEGQQLNHAKEVLAYEVTKQIHGEEEAKKALNAAKNVFSGSAHDENMPTAEIAKSELGEGIGILDLLVKSKIAPSKSEARRLVTQGGITVNDKKVDDAAQLFTEGDFHGGFIIVKKGKKSVTKVVLA